MEKGILSIEDFLKVQEVGIMDYQYFKGLENRELILNQDIDDDTVEKYIIPIIKWNKEDDANNVPVAERKPIKIYISCCGGSVSVGLGLVATIMNSKTPVHGVVLTYAYSMGFLILLACHKRIGNMFSCYLLHDGQMGVQNSTSKVRDYMEHQNKIEEFIKNFTITHSKISSEAYDKNYDKEWYMTSEKALELGVIDEIADSIV